MNTHRINNFRMGAYAALAAGIINLRYQSGEYYSLQFHLQNLAGGGYKERPPQRLLSLAAAYCLSTVL
jgi:hypothetical protein